MLIEFSWKILKWSPGRIATEGWAWSSTEKIRQLGEKKVPERGDNENPFSDEKMFDLGGTYNSQNDRIGAVNREEANWRGGKKQQRKFAEKLWYG